MNSHQTWAWVNQHLIAKSLSELTFEEILQPSLCAEEGPQAYQLQLKSGVIYRFTARPSIWGHIIADASSIQRFDGNSPSSAECAGQFFIDAQAELGMTDIVLGNFLEEMHATLFSDVRIWEQHGHLTAEEVSLWDGNKIQCILNGHPKILLNKGRMGWGAQDRAEFAPESLRPLQLHWIAALKSNMHMTRAEGITSEDILLECLSIEDLHRFTNMIRERNRNIEDYEIMPVHPWQWDQIVQIQFAGPLARAEMIYLGIAGDQYQPQISLRTLSNVTRPQNTDIKLPVTILNTSAIRGIPSRYTTLSTFVAKSVTHMCQTDPLLRNRGTEVLQDKAGCSYVHPTYRQVSQAPYRYHEYLGAIWRESVTAKLHTDEVGILTASLFYRDAYNTSLIGTYIRKSGLTIEDWLSRYFDVVVIPLYHLQLRYGLGHVAHGQNIVLRLRKFIPVGILLKDFHGDLRLADDVSTQAEIALSQLDRLPRAHLIHDLITGHFLTVLRFISDTLLQCDGFPEETFYDLLTQSIERYLHEHWNGAITKESDLLRPKLERVLVNKVRFNIGYADSPQRPQVMLGRDLKNPLFRGEHP